VAGTSGAQASEVDCVDQYHAQMRLQVCTLASATMILGRMDAAQTETTALLQQVLTMLQQGPVRQRACSLSMHSQVEPVGFNSETTRVCYYPCLSVHTNGLIPQVVANTTTSIVTFSILSPDASLSYDHIKLRLEEYRTLLVSDSDTIELSTENGKTVICRKQAKEMEQFLDRAETLLQDIVQSHEISTLVVLHRLRDLASVLDSLKLYDECRLTGNCALDLAEALGRRSLEFRHEQAETLALIAGLSVYQPRARTLFIQAVSVCEEMATNDASHSNKIRLLVVLDRAGYWASGDLRAQWLGHAIQLMTEELPPTMVHPALRSAIYNNYGNGLYQVKQYASAFKAYHEAISIYRTLANGNPVSHNYYLAQTVTNLGITLDGLGKYDDAVAAYKEALELCRAVSARDPLQYNLKIAKILCVYGVALSKLNKRPEAAEAEKQAISLYRDLVQTGNECTDFLCIALHNYGVSCYSLGQYAEAVLVYQEAITLRRAVAATDSGRELFLRMGLHDIANCFHALDKDVEANAAAIEALQRNRGRVLERCYYAPNFGSCFVCQRAMTPDSTSAH
jgi:tetratricopeptide (TPR) repeat protein